MKMKTRLLHWTATGMREDGGIGDYIEARCAPLDFTELVADFQTKFGQVYIGPVRDMPASIASLRKKLLLEELTELITAIDAGDPEEILDALVDMQYVLTGTVLAQGMSHIFDEAFRRVHRANMRKVLAGSRHESKRDSAHDILKPDGWQPAELSDLLKVKP